MTWRRTMAACAALLLATAAALLTMGRNPICTCGHVALWHPRIDAGNSQHLLDWYSPSHLIHGFLFYGIARAIARERPLQVRLLAAAVIECAWELAENSPAIIDRYRTATMALGYTGDSVVNSLADIGCMLAGFALARRLPVAASVAVCLGLELLTLAVIRDNLVLNVLMLAWPLEAVRRWQVG